MPGLLICLFIAGCCEIGGENTDAVTLWVVLGVALYIGGLLLNVAV